MPRKSNTRAASGSGTIRQRPDGTWEARFVVGHDPGTGKPIRKSIYAKTQKEVRQKLAQGDVSGARALLGRPYSRRVELTHGENEWSLRLLDEEKQGLPAGRYRCVFSAGEQSLPVTVRLDGETGGALLLNGEEPSLQTCLNEGRGRLFFWQAAK